MPKVNVFDLPKFVNSSNSSNTSIIFIAEMNLMVMVFLVFVQADSWMQSNVLLIDCHLLINRHSKVCITMIYPQTQSVNTHTNTCFLHIYIYICTNICAYTGHGHGISSHGTIPFSSAILMNTCNAGNPGHKDTMVGDATY